VRLIQNRWILLAILAFCVYETVATWNEIGRPAPAKYDLFIIFVGTIVSLLTVNLVVRTTFIGDRMVVGPIAVASLLWVLIRLARPEQQTVHIMREIVWLMWVISLIAGIFVLVRYPRGWSVSGSPSEKQS